MLDQILPIIQDPADYITALSLFKADSPLTGEEADKLLAVYAKYQPQMEAQTDPDYLKLCLAVDLLPGRTREDAGDLEALELGEGTVNALFAVKNLVLGIDDPTAGNVDRIVKQVRDEGTPMSARVLLARTALDCLTGTQNFTKFQAQIRELAAFLTGAGTEALDRYTTLVGEVKLKCRM